MIVSADLQDETIERICRAFWRRIYMYRHEYGRELPQKLPIEFMAHMRTALMHLDSDQLFKDI